VSPPDLIAQERQAIRDHLVRHPLPATLRLPGGSDPLIEA
jgi:hypothetical protein